MDAVDDGTGSLSSTGGFAATGARKRTSSERRVRVAHMVRWRGRSRSAPRESFYLPKALWPIREKSNPVTLTPFTDILAFVGKGAKPFTASLALVGKGAKPFTDSLAWAGKAAKNKLAHPAITDRKSVV